ncbi:MAG: nitroreductase family protein [Candidatus Krumholzibacteriia bacterium]
MDVLQAITARRAIKRFDPQHRMAAAEQAHLLRLAQLSPTAFNLQHCRYVVVTDPELRRRLRAASFDQSQVTDASLLVVVCADLDAWRKDPARYWSHLPQPGQAAVVEVIGRYYAGREQVARDEAQRSCGLAAQTLMLAGQGLGYDSCPMDGFDFDAVARLINLPADHLISMFVALGKALEPAPPRGGRLEPAEVIIENRFPEDA